jgi:hypothetical protein
MGVLYSCALSFMSKYLYQYCGPKPMTRVDINDNNQSSNNPYAQRSEIECMVEEMLEDSIIIPSQSSYSTLVVMVFKKDISWHMCPDYRELNKITIKDKFPIPIIDEFLDEIHGAIYFTKLDLHSGYHQIRMKEEDIPKTTF